MAQSDLEAAFEYYWRVLNGPPLVAEYQFLPDRKFRFDFAYIPALVGIECDGGTWSNGRHSTGKGFTNDCIKIKLAILAGWRVFRFTTDMLTNEPEVHLRPIIEFINKE